MNVRGRIWHLGFNLPTLGLNSDTNTKTKTYSPLTVNVRGTVLSWAPHRHFLNFLQKLCDVVNIIIIITGLSMRKRRHAEIKWFAEDHIVCKWQMGSKWRHQLWDPFLLCLRESLGKGVTRGSWPGICSKAVNLGGTKDLNNDFKSLVPS